FNRHVLAPGVSSLEQKAVGELLANGYLQAVVIGISVEGRSADSHGLIAEIRYAEGDVPRGVRCDPIDRVGGAGQACRVVVVILFHQVNGTRADKTGLQDPLPGKLILDTQVVLSDQGRMDDLVQERNVQV